MPDYAAIVLGCFTAAALCVAVQFCVKRLVEPNQYGYFRDLLLCGAWLLLSVWFGSPPARVVAGGAFLAGMTGLCAGLYPERPWRLCYLAIGFLCAVWGPASDLECLAAARHFLYAVLLEPRQRTGRRMVRGACGQ